MKNIFKSNLLKWTLVGGTIIAVGVSVYFLLPNKKSNIDDDVPQNVEDFLRENTFRIQFGITTADKNWLLNGTSWILNRDWSSNNYTFFLATNWHVTMCSVGGNYQNDWVYYDKGIPMGFKYFTELRLSFKTQDKQNIQSGYTKIEGASLAENSFNIVEPNSDDIDEWKIDISILRVDLSSYANQDSQLRQRLDKINAEAVNPGHALHSFTNSYEPCTGSNPYYVGGYPADTGSADWQQHKIAYSSLVSNDPHACVGNTPQVSNYVAMDQSDQYRFSVENGKTWMGGGSSGSMIVDSELNIRGIYWGGEQLIGGNDFWPRASIFGTKISDYEIR